MLGILFQAWAAFSPLATIVGTLGIACIVIAFVGAMFVPERLKMPLIGLGALLIVGAAIWQAAEAKGTHDAFKVVAEASLKNEQARTRAAQRVTEALAAQATKDIAQAQADNLKLKELNDALARDPRRDGVCLPRSLSRSLRSL